MSRRTKASITALKADLYAIVQAMRPMTVRQVFYQAVSRGLIEKREQEYKGTIGRLLTQMRKEGELPWWWLADNTRWMRKPDSYDNLTAMLEDSQQFYRRALWNDQAVYVEVWLEKDALAGVLYEVTQQWDVPLMVTRGYPSFSYLASAAETIRSMAKPTYLYYFGDHDPSGVDIPRHVEQEILRILGDYPGFPVFFERVAVNEDQIISLDLQTRPTKKTDSRAKHFKGESVEVDAIHPDTLRQMVENCIARHIDPTILENTRRIEQAERETLQAVICEM